MEIEGTKGWVGERRDRGLGGIAHGGLGCEVEQECFFFIFIYLICIIIIIINIHVGSY